MQQAHQRHCPQHHRRQSHLCGGGAGRDLLDFAREFQKFDSYEDDDTDKHHPCTVFLQQKPCYDNLDARIDNVGTHSALTDVQRSSQCKGFKFGISAFRDFGKIG